jgi:hypothetical protein
MGVENGNWEWGMEMGEWKWGMGMGIGIGMRNGNVIKLQKANPAH